MATFQPGLQRGGAELPDALPAHMQPLQGDRHQYDGLLDLIGQARFALLGEASHGTRDFYRERIAITQRSFGSRAPRRESSCSTNCAFSIPVPARSGMSCSGILSARR